AWREEVGPQTVSPEEIGPGLDPPPVEKTRWIWLDGTFVDWDKATIHVMTHSLHYGMAAFEGIRAYKTPKGPAIFRLQEHLRRLYDSAKIMGVQVPFPIEKSAEACREL